MTVAVENTVGACINKLCMRLLRPHLKEEKTQQPKSRRSQSRRDTMIYFTINEFKQQQRFTKIWGRKEQKGGAKQTEINITKLCLTKISTSQIKINQKA